MTPVMTYVVLPRMTQALGWWLHGRPAPWRYGLAVASARQAAVTRTHYRWIVTMLDR